MVKKGRKTLQGFLAALLMFTGILTLGEKTEAAENAADVTTDTQQTVQAGASLIAYEIPIEEITAAAGTEPITEESLTEERTEPAAEENLTGETAELTTEEVRIGAKTSDVTGVQISIFRYACSAMLAAMLFLAELLHIQKREKEGE